MPPTPFMGLTLPTVGITLGPEWATEVNAAFVQVDAHNHTTGQGVPIPTNGISLNADLPFYNFNATLLRSTIFVNNTAPLALVTDIGSLYVAGGNLYYNNTIGQQVQITQGAGLDASTVGGFGGDYGTSTASAFYTSATSTFTFWQAPNQSALMDFGPFTIHNTASIATGIQITAPNPLASSYQLTLPNSLPSTTSILTVSPSGQIGDTLVPDNATIQISGGALQVVPASIGPTQLVAENFVQSPTTGSITITGAFSTVANVTLNCSGRPIILMMMPDNSGTPAFISAQLVSSGNPPHPQVYGQFTIDGGSMGVSYGSINVDTPNVTPASVSFPPSAFTQFWQPSAGIHNFAFQMENASGAGYSVTIDNCMLTVYEL